MIMKILLISFLALAHVQVNAQEKATVCTTKFVPQTYTYNASPNPNECWEAVSHGILIKADKVGGFFSIPYLKLQELKKVIDTNEVVVEVVYFEEHSYDSGEDGNVLKITLNGTVIYDARKP